MKRERVTKLLPDGENRLLFEPVTKLPPSGVTKLLPDPLPNYYPISAQSVENFFTFLSFFPLPPTQPPGVKFKKNFGKRELEITTRSECIPKTGEGGLVWGRDSLMLIVLIREYFRQGKDRKITLSTHKYLETFGIEKSSYSYKEARQRMKRIYDATFWVTEQVKDLDTGQSVHKKFRMNVIQAWNVTWDSQNSDETLGENEIILDQSFIDMIQLFKTPFDLSAVKELRQSAFKLNLYWFTLYKTYCIFKKYERYKKGIPIYGENGLEAQLSSNYKQRRVFKAKLIEAIREIKEKVWPRMPVEIRGNLMFIEPQSVEDLGVEIHPFAEMKSTSGPPCPDCGKPLTLCAGKIHPEVGKLDNYFRCYHCKKNFYYRDYPNLYKPRLKK